MLSNLKTCLVLGGIVAAMTASNANAQYRGGGHYGGGWGGGHHGSSWGVSIGYGGFGGYYGNGYRPYGYYGGYYGYPRVGVAVYPTPYYYSSATYVQPVYSQAVVSQPAVVGQPVVSQSVVDPAPVVAQSPTTSFSNYPLTANRVRLRINMPSPDARLSINGQSTQQLGTDRLFDSPAMEAGKVFVYSLQATWMENGREVTRTKSIDVQVGHEYAVDFKADAEMAPAPMPKQ